MAKLTRANICYNLPDSPYSHIIVYENDDVIEYVFSSELYKDKFIKNLSINRTNINNSLTNRFGFEIKVDKLADIKLYASIEKRGFLIRAEKDIECLENITLNGQKLIIRN